MGSLYLHIPFCESKCEYCSFVSFAARPDLHERYFQAILCELERLATSLSVQSFTSLDTLFIGGGTPTVFGSSRLVRLVERCGELFGFSESPEISVEVNPGTVGRSDLEHLKNAGVNRLSIGWQSLDEIELKILGRIHDANQAVQCFRLARETGFETISVDLMSGLPGQKVETFSASLAESLALQPDHLSIYQLSIEAGTPFFERMQDGTMELPSEEDILEMDGTIDRFLDLDTDKGCWERYEISNYANNGKRCRHNLVYWRNQEYLAAGSSAVSYLDGVRQRRLSDPEAYIEAVERGRPVIEEQEKLSREASFRETVIMGLRLLEGVYLPEMEDRYGISFFSHYGDIAKKLIDRGLLAYREERISLTSRGLRLANQVMAELV